MKDPKRRLFKRLASFLPATPGQLPEDRAKDIDNVLRWLRNHGVDDSPEKSEPFKKAVSRAIPDGRTPEQKAKDVEGILNWVRNPKDNEGPETEPFNKVDQMLPDRPGLLLAF
jgi:hypothetical protein